MKTPRLRPFFTPTLRLAASDPLNQGYTARGSTHSWIVVAVVLFSLSIGRVFGGVFFGDFSSVTGLQLNGSAAQVGNVLQLTPAVGPRAGSAFTTARVALGAMGSFSTYFQFRMSSPGGNSDTDGIGADGLVFVLQTAGSTAVGGAGVDIGYSGIAPSLGIEFDTWNNGTGLNDPNGNHVGLNLNGSLTSVATANEPVRFNNGQIWNVWVDYNGASQRLEVRWSLGLTRPAAAQLV